MSIEFKNVTFSYDSEKPVFTNLSVELPGGVTSLVGQNGTGKSTFMLLSGGRLMPQSGSVLLAGRDTAALGNEKERNQLASFVYQNMEFETEETVKELLTLVFQNGLHSPDEKYLVDELINEFELESVLTRSVQNTSKGEMQKINIAFSLLYGSRILFMDEPVFALEDHWKDRVLKYLKGYAHKMSISLYYSIHELDLSRKFSDNGILFFKDGSIACGPAEKLFQRENVEDAYQVPMELLYKRERLFRDHLIKPMNPDEMKALDQTVKVIDE